MAALPQSRPVQAQWSAPVGLRRIMVARGMRAFGDGLVAILLPVHLAQLGFGAVGTGLIATSTLLGSALLTLGLGLVAHRVSLRRGLLAAALLMTGTGLGFACLPAFWPLLLVAVVGTLNPAGGDVSVFLPLEHTIIAQLATDQTRTAAYARYSFIGTISAAVGSLAIGSLDWLEQVLPTGTAVSALFLLYGVIGLATLLLYAGLPEIRAAGPEPVSALGPSRRRVHGLATLFAVDAFGGGFIVNSLLALWLFECFGLSVATAGMIFFATGICSALLPRRCAARGALRPGQHDGVHAPALQCSPHPGCPRANAPPRYGAAGAAQPVVADGRADALFLRDGGC